MDALTKEAAELEIKDAVQLASIHAKELIESKKYTAQKFVAQHLLAMKNKMLTAVAQVNKLLLRVREDDFARAIARGISDYFADKLPASDVVDKKIALTYAAGAVFNCSKVLDGSLQVAYKNLQSLLR